MAGNMPKEEAMLNYVEELQKVNTFNVFATNDEENIYSYYR